MVNRNGYHGYLYDTEYNPFYEGIQTAQDVHDSSKQFPGRYRHQVVVPQNDELAFRYYSFAASQNHSRSLRVLGDYYWYQLPPVDLFWSLSNMSFDLHRSHYYADYGNVSGNSTEIVRVDEYDQRSMALSIAYLSTPQSIARVADKEASHFESHTESHHKSDDVDFENGKLDDLDDSGHSAASRSENDYLERHQVIACYMYQLSSLQKETWVDGQGLYDLAYCFEHGLGKKRNVSRAREIYWRAMNESADAEIPVALTLLRMETVDMFHVILNEARWRMSFVSYQDMENGVLVIAVGMLILVLLLRKLARSGNRDERHMDEPRGMNQDDRQRVGGEVNQEEEVNQVDQ